MLAYQSHFKSIYTFLALSLIVNMTSIHAADVLNNDRLRFGTGSSDSVNSSGNLLQPFYYSTNYSGWRKLTYSSYPLDFELGEGGDGSSWWNRNGSFSYNPNLSGQTIDTSGFTSYNGGANGYGTIISEGQFTVNGKAMEIRTTYELPETKSYVKVTTQLKNVSGVAMSNLRYWVGTRDDYVGLTDSPRKQKGNLVDDAFELIPNSTTRAKALKISTADEGVLFYTDTDEANVIIGASYGWSNIQNRNPEDSPIDIQSDNSYAFYVRLNDLAPNETQELVWYYAAGPVDQLDNIVASVSAAAGAVENISYLSADLKVTSDVEGMGYYVVVLKDEPEPTESEIEAGIDYGAVAVVTNGSGAVTASVERVYTITNLNYGTEYDLYFVLKDTNDVYTAIQKSSFATSDPEPVSVVQTNPSSGVVVSGHAFLTYQVVGYDEELTNSGSLLMETNGVETFSFTNMTDIGSASRRFYRVLQVDTNESTVVTNPVLYVAHRTNLEPDNWYRYSLGIDYGSSNRLDSTLGEQLANGLNGDDEKTSADLLYFMDSGGSWITCYLDSSGVWRRYSNDAPATDAISPWQSFWIRRRSSGGSSTPVYYGSCYTNSLNLAFRAGDWHLISWPFPEDRKEGDNSNGWEFSADGAQTGTSWLSADVLVVGEGDQTRFYYLHTSGRWCPVGSTTPVGSINFRLGESYYYLHRGSGFNWTINP